MSQTCTLVYLIRDGRVCLGMKKRGHGVGRWNGFGGKVQPGEAERAAARREFMEETGIRVHDADLEAAGELTFTNTDVTRIDANLRVVVFRVSVPLSDPVETEEMWPRWFSIDAVPYEEMWPDDRLWMPNFFAGAYVRGHFAFAGDELVEYALKT